MEKIVLLGHNFMLENHLKQPGRTYCVCGPFAKGNEQIQKLQKTGDSRCIYWKELDKAWFHNDVAYGDFKDLLRWTDSNEILHDKAFEIASNTSYDVYQGGLAAMLYIFITKILLNSSDTAETTATGLPKCTDTATIAQNQKLADDLCKTIVRKCKKTLKNILIYG